MDCTSFAESNRVLYAPDGMTSEQCEPLSVYTGTMDGTPVTISCWKPTKEELEEFNRTGRMWLIVCGESMFPSAMTAISPFIHR